MRLLFAGYPQMPYYLINFAADRERPSFFPRATRGKRKSKIVHTRTIDHELLVFSVTPFKIDQNKNQNHSTGKFQNLGNERR